MKFIELLNTTSTDQIILEISKSYEDDVKNFPGYENAINELRAMEPTPQVGSIVIALHRNDEQNYYHVSLKYDDNETYSMSFIPWRDLLDREVVVKDCDLTPEQMLAHILWEITFYGYSAEDVQDQGDIIMTDIKDMMSLINDLPENPTDEDYKEAGLTKWNPKK